MVNAIDASGLSAVIVHTSGSPTMFAHELASADKSGMTWSTVSRG
jgi:hypothetical protein